MSVVGCAIERSQMAGLLSQSPMRPFDCKRPHIPLKADHKRDNQVPLNHSEPEGQEAAIALIRKPALIPSTSIFYRGPILFNPGGPGGSGVDLIQGANGDLLSIIVGPRFDVVGFDPRGE